MVNGGIAELVEEEVLVGQKRREIAHLVAHLRFDQSIGRLKGGSGENSPNLAHGQEPMNIRNLPLRPCG